MALSFEVHVACLADLVQVDVRVRALCNTTTGAQCQSLLTTEYQCCRRTVARMLLAHCAPPHGATKTYLSGIRVRFVPPTCLITHCPTHSQRMQATCASANSTRSTFRLTNCELHDI